MLKGREKFYTLSGTIPAGASNQVFAKDIDGSVVFNSRNIKGQFETLEDDGAGNIVDYGVCRTTFKVVEGGTDYQFMDNFVFMDQLLTPGRKKSPLATNNDTAPATNPIVEPVEFVHTFQNRIEILASNSSDVDQFFSITIQGNETKMVMGQ